MNVLFICNQNQNRSKTAEELFQEQFNTRSAGLHNQKPVTEKQLQWADIIMVMEEGQRQELAKRFPQLYLQKRILSLEIPDEYNYGDAQLKRLLRRKVGEWNGVLVSNPRTI